MHDYYTLKQAMELLGTKGTKAFLHLERRYPEMFINMNQGRDREKNPRYNKAALDRLHKLRKDFKQQNPRSKIADVA